MTDKHKKNDLLFRLFVPFVTFPYLPKWTILSVDSCLSAIAFAVSYIICFDLLKEAIVLNGFLIKVLLNIFVSVLFFYLFRTYSGIIRHTTDKDFIRILGAVAASNIALFLFSQLFIRLSHPPIFPANSGFIINFTLTFMTIFTVRSLVKWAYDFAMRKSGPEVKKMPLMIYGVSPSNIDLAEMITNHANAAYDLAGFIASDEHAADKRILGVPVFYGNGSLEQILSKKRIKALLINSIELDREVKQKVAETCIKCKVELLTLPPISEWRNVKEPLREMKKIRIEDLLGRAPIRINSESIEKGLSGKSVLITGAAGSIGSEIARQVSKFRPGLLIICDIAESPLHQLQLELEKKHPQMKLLPVIGDVRNTERMKRLFKSYKPQIIYHAAAYKHVPLMEDHPSESVLTNILGTKNVVDLAVRYEAEAFVMISTDKAVNPSNVMGASKRIAEIYVQSLSRKLQKQTEATGGIRVITTRFGNVLGSNGSVLPHFQEQIESGGPVTVTHKDIIRYFMTIPEACRLVLEAGNMGKGGEIFIFDMGEPVKILDLAENMIRLYQYEPYTDIDIVFTGLRPGEKLYEELLNDKEQTKSTHNDKIMIAAVREYDFELVSNQVSVLTATAKLEENTQVVEMMKKMVPEFISCNSKYERLDKIN